MKWSHPEIVRLVYALTAIASLIVAAAADFKWA